MWHIVWRPYVPVLYGFGGFLAQASSAPIGARALVLERSSRQFAPSLQYIRQRTIRHNLHTQMFNVAAFLCTP